MEAESTEAEIFGLSLKEAPAVSPPDPVTEAQIEVAGLIVLQQNLRSPAQSLSVVRFSKSSEKLRLRIRVKIFSAEKLHQSLSVVRFSKSSEKLRRRIRVKIFSAEKLHQSLSVVRFSKSSEKRLQVLVQDRFSDRL